MITNEQISNLTDTQKDLLLLNLMEKLESLEDRFCRYVISKGDHPNYFPNEHKKDSTEYPAVDTAPEWNVWFKLNTSVKDIEITIPQKAWTEKQAIYLARTEVLFPSMCKQVKEKRIEAKWSILDAVATKA